ncbi:uncharacterized protein BX663DRAFT_557373 [Cokeromyces recurvatus]|uniref:uncharacterized protein n=1 Tax=Cokeromyces recurvatus TaxID=90255 RepID=UPI00221F7616|nr:uncharacterized protein BX663DRAFT_557373 [Cokeromyces recurvatus]KAI7908215.1 hypothetical protein BX663DRAFT_557373 [Cokeromyces recurvatus]
MTENKRSIFILTILVLFFTLFYLFYTPSQKSSGTTKAHQQDLQESFITSSLNRKPSTICDKVDIPWLAGDRVYWDGWTDKAMFIKQDGTFTKGNVYIQENEQVCIVVLLGPTPAKSSVKNEDHLGPRDSIALFAKGNKTTLTIVELEQHATQLNAYFAPVQFNFPDIYQLHGLNEFRSYFWESPILHTYRPFQFISENKVIVQQQQQQQQQEQEQNRSLPECSSRQHVHGAWIDLNLFSQTQPKLLYSMFENSENDFIDGKEKKVFVPDQCQLNFKSTGYAARCLNKKTIHIWADDHIKRNLKALHFNGQVWCHENTNDYPHCICHEEDESSLYPWAHDPFTPFVLNNALGIHTEFYYNTISTDIAHNGPSILNSISSFMDKTTKKADIVILGLGNKDIESYRISPEQFAIQFKEFILTLRQDLYYPYQTILIRTPQYYCCGIPLKGTSWNNGRSMVFTKIVRHIIQDLENTFVWDVHALGTNENTCITEGTSYSKRHVVYMENQLLWHLLCPKRIE